MFHELASRNDDVRRLVEKGYAIAFIDSHLVVRDIPYLDAERRLQQGALVSVLKFLDPTRVAQEDHQVLFAGSHPHSLGGTPIPNLGGGPTTKDLHDTSIVIQRSFSNKPVNGFPDLFEKVESYVRIISGPAMELHGATPLTFRVDQNVVKDSIFKFNDTLTSRAGIGDLARKLHDDRVVIIGLGGTGSYLLDLLVKSPVREIRGFDKDLYHVHNAFRSPGQTHSDDFDRPKAHVYGARYDNFRHGLSLQAKFIDATCAPDVEGATFAFVCIDKGSSRAGVFDLLIASKIPFIDVGMGLDRRQGPLNGKVRATYYSVENAGEMRTRGLAELADAPDDEYRRSVQVAELNALNAAIAVIRFKQLRGYYLDSGAPNHLLFDIEDLRVFRD